MPLPQTFSLLVLGQGSTGLDVSGWALDHPERVSSVTVYGGAGAAATEATRAQEARGARFVYGTEQVEGRYDVCVASPGISEFSDFFAAGRDASGQIMGEPEFTFRLSPERWCAITGTNGKTTTTTLVNHLMHEAGMSSVAVGNIGEPPIHQLDARTPGEWFVAELSSFQLATSSELHPRVAVLLNITQDHLAWHRTHENYARAKMRMFRNMGGDDLAIIDVEDEGIAQFVDLVRVPGRRVLDLGFADTGARDAAFVRDGQLIVRLKGDEVSLVPVADLQIKGHHNVVNALAAAAAALACGVPADAVRRGLANFHPLEHRIEPCGAIDGIRYYNDSKATNTDAVEKALTAFPDDDVVLLLGGHDKGTPLESFAADVVAHVRAVVCYGEAAARFRAAIEAADGSESIDIACADHLRDAVDVARSLAGTVAPAGVVLLSPACSSFDEFSGFEERGRAFKAYLDEIRAREADASADE